MFRKDRVHMLITAMALKLEHNQQNDRVISIQSEISVDLPLSRLHEPRHDHPECPYYAIY